MIYWCEPMRKLVCSAVALALAFCCGCDASAQVFYVDAKAPANGDGSQERPFASPYEVRDGLRKLRKAGLLATNCPVVVCFANGDYPVFTPVVLEKEDSGTAAAPIVWKSAEKNGARFTGGVRVDSRMFKPLEDKAVLKRIPEEARGKIFVADLSGLIKEEFPPMSVYFQGAPTRPAVYFNHKPGTIARWPNTGWTDFTNCVDVGFAKRREGHREYVGKRPGSFIYNNKRVERWNFEDGVWINGYLTHDWHNESVKLESVTKSPTNTVLNLAHQTTYGVAGGTWGRKYRRFYVFNTIDELDAPGEYYVDRAKKLLYICLPEAAALSEIEIVIVNSDADMIQSKKKDLEFFCIDGISFEYSNKSAMFFDRVRNVCVTNCFIGNINRTGIYISGYSNIVAGCEIAGIGRTGVDISGGDRMKLVNSGSVAEGNEVHDFGRYQRTYAAAFRVHGCGMAIRGNKMYDAPHSAVLYSGNEHLFEYNEVYNVLKETGDAGAYYTGRDWTTQGNVLRYNFTHHLGDMNDDHSSTMGFYFDDCDCGDEVYGNIFWKVARGIMIGGGREHPVRNNIFAECNIGLSIDCRGMTWKQWNIPGGSWHLEGKAEQMKYKEEPWKSRYPRLANIMNDSPQQPLYNPVENNIFIDCKKEVLALDGTIKRLIDKVVVENNLVINTYGTNGVAAAKINELVKGGFKVVNGSKVAPFDAGFVDWRSGDFTLKEDGWVRKNFPAFKPFKVR